MRPVTEIMQDWHDLFMLFGTASATLVGLLFVAASVGSSYYTKDQHPALRLFLSPTVVNFTCVLAGSLIAITPLRSWSVLGILIGGGGLYGIAYSSNVWHRMVRQGLSSTIDLEDRLCYAALPAAGYAVMFAAGVMLLLRMAAGCDVLAAAMGVLLLVGIRNAWDMTIFTVVRRPN